MTARSSELSSSSTGWVVQSGTSIGSASSLRLWDCSSDTTLSRRLRYFMSAALVVMR